VFFAGKDEIIEIKHTALSRDILGRGAIRAARYTASKARGFYNMKTMLEELI
jgi:4-hydroxy-tetrahydrodipicolinate reductase